MVRIPLDSLVDIPALSLHTGWQLLVLEERPADHGPTGGMSKDMLFHGQAEWPARGGLVLHVLSQCPQVAGGGRVFDQDHAAECDHPNGDGARFRLLFFVADVGHPHGDRSSVGRRCHQDSFFLGLLGVEVTNSMGRSACRRLSRSRVFASLAIAGNRSRQTSLALSASASASGLSCRRWNVQPEAEKEVLYGCVASG